MMAAFGMTVDKSLRRRYTTFVVAASPMEPTFKIASLKPELLHKHFKISFIRHASTRPRDGLLFLTLPSLIWDIALPKSSKVGLLFRLHIQLPERSR